MKLPIKSISLGGQSIALAIDSSQAEFGVTHFDSKRITFSEACVSDPKLFWPTLRHEMQHMALMIGGPAWSLTDGENESIIRCMDELFFPAWDLVSLRRTKLECRAKPDGQPPESTS